MATIDCTEKTTREINLAIKQLIAEGSAEVILQNPAARHNLGIALLQGGKVTIAGSVGYYCGGLGDGPQIEVQGSAGWGVAESMLSGTVIVQGDAGNGAAASMRGGTVVIHGDAAARAGISIKGGTLLIGGSCGYMTGFMGQKGTIIVCGDAGEAFADSMYETVCFVGGRVEDLGNDAVIETPSPAECAMLESMLSQYLATQGHPPIGAFKKVVAGRKLWNFDKREWKTWREAL